jgi:hypothetical protein
VTSTQKRCAQVAYVVVLGVVALVNAPTRALAQEQVAWCNICLNECDDLEQACHQWCPGSIVQWGCNGASSCTGQGGGTYSGSGRCLMSQP